MRIDLYEINGQQNYSQLQELYHDELLNLFERGETLEEAPNSLWGSDENMGEFCGGEVYKLLKKLPAEVRHNYAESFVKNTWFSDYSDDEADFNFPINPAEFYFEHEPEEVLGSDLYDDGLLADCFTLIEQGVSNKLVANFGEYFCIELDLHMLAKSVAQYLVEEAQGLTGEVYLTKREVVPEYEIKSRAFLVAKVASKYADLIQERGELQNKFEQFLCSGLPSKPLLEQSDEEILKIVKHHEWLEEFINEGLIKHNK
jgi:hypothetical protein